MLVLGGVMTHERPAGEEQVGTRGVESFINEEILLFPAEVGCHLGDLRVEVTAYIGSRHIDRMEGTQQRCLVVERLAAVTDEDSRDAERVFDDEDW